ncbi:MAG: hypothetical protein LC100_16620 [Chitinophagales bacterium]|nr:hypothetical protein [Chitinophagales bacterium]
MSLGVYVSHKTRFLSYGNGLKQGFSSIMSPTFILLGQIILIGVSVIVVHDTVIAVHTGFTYLSAIYVVVTLAIVDDIATLIAAVVLGCV